MLWARHTLGSSLRVSGVQGDGNMCRKVFSPSVKLHNSCGFLERVLDRLQMCIMKCSDCCLMQVLPHFQNASPRIVSSSPGPWQSGRQSPSVSVPESRHVCFAKLSCQINILLTRSHNERGLRIAVQSSMYFSVKD